jgi:hypothetical protein
MSIERLGSIAALSAIVTASSMNGCASGANCPNSLRNPSTEYKEGVLTVAGDPPCQAIKKPMETTRLQVLVQMGAGAEGLQKNGGWVLCADMGPILSGKNADESDYGKVAGRFEPVLLDQASHLMVADKCAKFLNVNDDLKCVSNNCDNTGLTQLTTGSIKYAEGEAKGLGTFRFKHSGKYVCLWTTPPQEIVCK